MMLAISALLAACTQPDDGNETAVSRDSARDSADDTSSDRGCDFTGAIEIAAGGPDACVRKADGSVCCDVVEWGATLPADYAYQALAVNDLAICGATGTVMACAYAGEVREVEAAYTRLEAGHQDGVCGWPSADGLWECFTEWGELLPVPAVAFAEVAAIYDDSGCGIDPAGEIQCWGDKSPQGTPPPGPFTRIAATSQVGCGLRPEGTIACWGDESGPRDAAPTNDGWIDVDATAVDMCARRGDDAGIYCWGGTIIGDWPDGPVAGGTRFSTLDGGFFYVCGIREEDSYPECAYPG